MSLAKTFILLGLALLALGLTLQYFPKLLNWFGKLPGDIRMEGEHSFFFFPITSMLIISLILSLLFQLFLRR